MEIKNAKIAKVTLGYEDHGMLSAMIHLDYGGAGQGFGGYALDGPVNGPDGKFSHREGGKFGMMFIQEVIDTVGVKSWEKLVGESVRVECSMSEVKRIGHYLENRWFNPKELAERLGVQ